MEILGDSRVLAAVGAFFYCIAFVYALVQLTRGHRYPRSLLITIIGLGFVAQTAALYLRGLETSSCPLHNPFEILQFITWSAVLLYFVVGPAYRMSLLGFFTSGLVAFFSTLSLLVPGWDRVATPQKMHPLIETHAALAIFSYGVFAVLAVTSIMYLTQNYGLKSKRAQGLFRYLPSIVQIDHMNNRLLLLGTSVLTFAIVVGMFYWMEDLGRIEPIKFTFTLLVWFGYSLVLVLRLTHKIFSGRFAFSCVLLFVMALLSLWPVDASRYRTAPAEVPTLEVDVAP